MNEELTPNQEVPQQIPQIEPIIIQNQTEPIIVESTPVELGNTIAAVSVVQGVEMTPMPVKSKSMVKYIIILIALGLLSFFGYQNYRATTISYTATIPVWLFDDKERIVVKNDQYQELKVFMFWSYKSFLKDLDAQYSYTVMSGFEKALASWDQEYFINNKQILIGLEGVYTQNNMFNKLYKILSTWDWWHIDPNTPSLERVYDYLSLSKDITRDLSFFMILRCELDKNENRCAGYQLLSKLLLKNTQRKSWYIGDLIHWNIQKYLIQQEKISHTNLDICKDISNREQLSQNTLKDEYNVVFKSLINDSVNEVIKSLEENKRVSRRKWIPNFIFRATNKDTLAAEIRSQADTKWQQRFYNLIQWNDNNSFWKIANMPPITKIILATLWIAPNYLLWDVLSDELVGISLAFVGSMKSKYKDLADLCNTK